MKIHRRHFIRGLFVAILSAIITMFAFFWLKKNNKKSQMKKIQTKESNSKFHSQNGQNSQVYMVQNGSPEENMIEILNKMGGIEKFIGNSDIVILKPNAQWWHQGMTNTNAMKAFIDLVLEIPNFAGEIIIAENHHIKEDNSRGWTTECRNGDYNLNELIEFFQSKGNKNVTKYHLHDGGPNPNPREGNAGDGKIVRGPWEGDGYVWCDDAVYVSPENRKCMMTYPIFTSSYSNITIDLKNGAWKDGNYLNVPVKFINFSALNHHGYYAGITASIKNLMGVTDLTCGYHGSTPEGFFNVHFIGYENFIHRLGTRFMFGFARRNMNDFAELMRSIVEIFGIFNFWYAGGALGFWMSHIRKPDLNIITAENVGYGGRTDPTKSANTKTVLASTDPVALDYCAVKHVLLPATKNAGDKGLPYLKTNDTDYLPFKNFLTECQRYIGGTFDEKNIELFRYNLKSGC